MKNYPNLIPKYKVLYSDEDLNYTKYVAYQRDRDPCVSYNKEYFNNYEKRAGSEIAKKLNAFRVSLVEKYCKNHIVDVGIGSGEFIESNKNLLVCGYDINPYGIEWLAERKLFYDFYTLNTEFVEGFTLWDTLEHMKNPCRFTNEVLPGQYVFVCLPTFEDVMKVKQSKHYKPNEHYYYFNNDGFKKFMRDMKFEFIEMSDEESKIGRENIFTFVFRKN